MFGSIVEAVFSFSDLTPDALCIADAKTSYTYIQTKNAVLRTAADLSRAGVKRNDFVLVECTQNAAYCICKLSLELLGAVFVPFDRKISAERLEEISQETGAVCIAGTNAGQYGLQFYPLSSISPEGDQPKFEYRFPNPDERSELLYSTGTTGKAKGIDLTHGNNVALANNVASGVKMEPGNVELVPVSLSHSHGLRTLYANFYNGNAVVITSGVTFLKPFFTLIDRWHVTSMDLVPSAWRILCEHGGEQLAKYQDQIKYVQLGSAPLTDDDKAKLRKYLPKSRLYNFYGSTESGRTCTFDFAAFPDKSNCIGKPVVTANVLIVDGEHRPLAHSSAEQTGYLAFQGAMNMTGYWKNPELTASVLRNGVFYTKDIGYIDADGWVYMLGRDDDIINYGGVKINPLDIEEAAMRCPAVADCGCIGHEDPVSGHAPWLFVQLHPDADMDEDGVSAWLMKNIDRERMPKRVIAIEEIPRTFNGKILRRALKETAEKYS